MINELWEMITVLMLGGLVIMGIAAIIVLVTMKATNCGCRVGLHFWEYGIYNEHNTFSGSFDYERHCFNCGAKAYMARGMWIRYESVGTFHEAALRRKARRDLAEEMLGVQKLLTAKGYAVRGEGLKFSPPHLCPYIPEDN